MKRPAAADQLDLSVVIVNWNTGRLLDQCLTSLRTDLSMSGDHRRHLRAETFVVDNGSTDESQRVSADNERCVQFIQNRDNRGFAGANNQAIRSSSGRYVLLLNPDTEVRAGAIETLVRFMDEHPDAGAAGPLLLNPDGTLQDSCFPAPSLLRELWRLLHLDAVWPYGSYRQDRWSLASPHLVDVVQGACLVIRRHALDQIGLLDEDYFIYSEEVDLCQRLRERGWSVYWVPGATVVHYGGQSTRLVAQAMLVQLYRAKTQYFRKHGGDQTARVYKSIILLAAGIRLTLALLFLGVPSPARRHYLVLARHYRRLVRELPSL